jgi:hypothetical protein
MSAFMTGKLMPHSSTASSAPPSAQVSTMRARNDPPLGG